MDLSFSLYLVLQCFDTVGWVIWPVKPVPDMTYNVSGGTLNLALSIYLVRMKCSTCVNFAEIPRNSLLSFHGFDACVCSHPTRSHLLRCEPRRVWVQWRRYTRACLVKWPGWKIHRPGSALPSSVYCFASVIVWTENENVTISDRFICFILTLKRLWRPATTKKGRQLFWGKKCIRVTWLENFLTSKWPGSFTALAPPLSGWRVVHCCRPSDVEHADSIACRGQLYALYATFESTCLIEASTRH